MYKIKQNQIGYLFVKAFKIHQALLLLMINYLSLKLYCLALGVSGLSSIILTRF